MIHSVLGVGGFVGLRAAFLRARRRRSISLWGALIDRIGEVGIIRGWHSLGRSAIEAQFRFLHADESH